MAEEYVERLVQAIQVSDAKYEEARTTYQSICEWLGRRNSTLRADEPETYLQGSFRLGTAIRPTTDEDHYDLDIVCTLHRAKNSVTQAKLKADVGVEVKSYSEAQNMSPPVDARRCWTQEYSDERQFHVDILPSIADETGLRERLQAFEKNAGAAAGAIAITDKQNPNYEVITDRWLHSNPTGYAAWFEEQSGFVFRQRREAIALRESRNVNDIPAYRVRSPLQKAVQLLKYHRDVMFAEDSDHKPISIIITTLAAKAYHQEQTTQEALSGILHRMHEGIEQDHGVDWVRNPSNPLENFADKWIEHPIRRENFYKWLEQARADFAAVAHAGSENEAKKLISEAFGDETLARVPRESKMAKLSEKLRRLTTNYRQAPPWAGTPGQRVTIYKAVKSLRGFRTVPFSSDSAPIPKGASLQFYARTDVPMPYQVYWQVVNTGQEAERDNGQRGGFDVGSIQSGKLIRKEGTKYMGSHTIECFVVKNDRLVARSGRFIVNIL
jgi:hypothetical protein